MDCHEIQSSSRQSEEGRLCVRVKTGKKSVMRSVLFQATSIKPQFQPYADVNWILISLNPDNYEFPLPNV